MENFIYYKLITSAETIYCRENELTQEVVCVTEKKLYFTKGKFLYVESCNEDLFKSIYGKFLQNQNKYLNSL